MSCTGITETLLCQGGVMTRTGRHSCEIRGWAVRMLLAHEREFSSHWAAIVSIEGRIGHAPVGASQVGTAGRDRSGGSEGLPSNERAQIEELEREDRGLRRANEILSKASASVAQAELDRRPKR